MVSTDMNRILRDELRCIFNRHDPMGIFVDDKTNFDEYDPEINGLLIRFNRSRNLEEFTREIYTVFQNMFLLPKNKPNKKLDKLAKNVYNALKS